jgi:hypothetical protein
MYPIITASLITAITVLLDLRGKCVKPVYKYLAIFFIVAGINFLLLPSKAEAIDFSSSRLFERPTFEKRPGNTVIFMGKSPQLIKKEFMVKCKEKMDYHYEEGCKSLKEVEDASLLLPDSSHYDKAAFCLTSAVATMAPGDPTLRVIGAAIAICGQYGLMVMAEWQRLDTKLHQAKHHFEMEEHYRMMGKYVQAQYNSEK